MSRDLSHLIKPLKNHFQDESWDVWFEELEGKADNTIYAYSRCLIEFLEYKNMTPEQLEKEYKTQLDSEDKKVRKRLGREIKNFMNTKVGEGLSRSRSEMYLKGLRSFMNAMGLQSVQVNGLEKVHSTQQATAQKNHIKLLMENTTNPRNRAVIMVAKDSGLRVSDIVRIQIKHVSESLENGDAFCAFSMITEKEKIPCYPVIGYESLQFVREWLRIRERMGFSVDPESPLFCKMTLENGEVVAVNSDSIANTIRKISKNAEIPEITCHSLRRFHTTRLASLNMNSNWIKLLQGKSLGSADKSYYDPSELINLYPKFYHGLKVYSTEVDRSEINGLKRQNEDLQRQLTEIKKDYEDKQNYYAVNLASEIEKALIKMGLRPMTEEEVKADLEQLKKESA